MDFEAVVEAEDVNGHFHWSLHSLVSGLSFTMSQLCSTAAFYVLCLTCSLSNT